ncbi:MAG: hypothetical protein IJ661_11965 [Lachnospiraceae bacterium]|nr:hypothetical protein [Lachnospiraceae bacterium]
MENNCYIEKYDFMCATEKIGDFYVDHGVCGRSFKVILDTDLSNSNGFYDKLFVLQKNNIIDDKGVRFFIEHRVMPKARMNCNELLQEMGFSEYDQYEIFRYNSGACEKDYYWVKFLPNLTFYDVNYKAEAIMSKMGFIIDDLKNRKLC